MQSNNRATDEHGLTRIKIKTLYPSFLTLPAFQPCQSAADQIAASIYLVEFLC